MPSLKDFSCLSADGALKEHPPGSVLGSEEQPLRTSLHSLVFYASLGCAVMLSALFCVSMCLFLRNLFCLLSLSNMSCIHELK